MPFEKPVIERSAASVSSQKARWAPARVRMVSSGSRCIRPMNVRYSFGVKLS